MHDFHDPLKRLYLALGAVLLTMMLGVLGYYLLGGGEWPLLDCIYMTVITLTTVGFGEIVPIENYPSGRIFTMILLLAGSGTIVFFISQLTAFVVEGQLRHLLQKRRIEKAIRKMNDHIIVCGIGETGLHVCEELVATRTPFIMVDKDESRLAIACEVLGQEAPYVVGDASDDAVLLAAGVDHARGVIAACTQDKDNLFIIVSAKQINPQLKIVTKAIGRQSERKLIRAGADKVVSTNFIGGLRMASEMIRPTVTTFLDRMMRDASQAMRLDQVEIPSQSSMIGKPLKELGHLRDRSFSILAIEPTRSDRYIYNPSPDTPMTEGMVLVCLGEVESMSKLTVVQGNFS